MFSVCREGERGHTVTTVPSLGLGASHQVYLIVELPKMCECDVLPRRVLTGHIQHTIRWPLSGATLLQVMKNVCLPPWTAVPALVTLTFPFISIIFLRRTLNSCATEVRYSASLRRVESTLPPSGHLASTILPGWMYSHTVTQLQKGKVTYLSDECPDVLANVGADWAEQKSLHLHTRTSCQAEIESEVEGVYHNELLH